MQTGVRFAPMTRLSRRARYWGAIALVAGFVLCLAGLMLSAIGEATRSETLVAVGGRLTLPLTFFYAGLLVVILVGAVALGALSLARGAARTAAGSFARLRRRRD